MAFAGRGLGVSSPVSKSCDSISRALISEMAAAFAKGDVEHARSINARMQDSFAFMNNELTPNPVPTKAMLRVLGLPAGQCRLPLGPAPDGLEDAARQILAGLGADAPKSL